MVSIAVHRIMPYFTTMKRLLFSVLFAATTIAAHAQTKAVTETGEEVFLYTDGTWKYVDIKPAYATNIDTIKVNKGANATFLVKSPKFKYGIWIDPKKWKFVAGKDGESQELKFSLKSKEAQGAVIAERVEMPYASLQEVALINAKQAAEDAHIAREEIRLVNGKIVRLMQIEGTIAGLKFVYFGYYYVGNEGTFQFVTYTYKSTFEENVKEMEQLLNGFVIL